MVYRGHIAAHLYLSGIRGQLRSPSLADLIPASKLGKLIYSVSAKLILAPKDRNACRTGLPGVTAAASRLRVMPLLV